MDLGLRGKVALVTGASRGIGKAIAQSLLDEGCRVAICARDSDRLRAAVDDLSHGANGAIADCVIGVPTDVTDDAAVQKFVAMANKKFGRIDILVNNAATLDHAAQLPNQSYELWDRDVRVNLTGAFNCTKEVWPYMVENKWGRIIFMSSVAGTLGGFGQASYSATKAALIGLARTAALEGGRHNITANAIAPGIIESEAGKAAAANNPMYDRFRARTVFKRFGQPEDIANTIAFLCSDEAGYITGAVIEVAGGIPLFTA